MGHLDYIAQVGKDKMAKTMSLVVVCSVLVFSILRQACATNLCQEGVTPCVELLGQTSQQCSVDFRTEMETCLQNCQDVCKDELPPYGDVYDTLVETLRVLNNSC